MFRRDKKPNPALFVDPATLPGAKKGGVTEHISGPHLIPNVGREAMVPAEVIRRRRPAPKTGPKKASAELPKTKSKVLPKEQRRQKSSTKRSQSRSKAASRRSSSSSSSASSNRGTSRNQDRRLSPRRNQGQTKATTLCPLPLCAGCPTSPEDAEERRKGHRILGSQEGPEEEGDEEEDAEEVKRQRRREEAEVEEREQRRQAEMEQYREAERRRLDQEQQKLKELEAARTKHNKLEEQRRAKLGGAFAFTEDDIEAEKCLHTQKDRVAKELADAKKRAQEWLAPIAESPASVAVATVPASTDEGSRERPPPPSNIDGNHMTAADIDGAHHEHKFASCWKDWDSSKARNPGEVAKQLMKIAAIKRRGQPRVGARTRSRSRSRRRR